MASVDTKKILVVDDEEVIRNFYRDSLIMRGYAVDSAKDGLEALGALWDSVYDLVITDIDMPRLNGLGFYENALASFPYLKDRFLFITGSPPAGADKLYRSERVILKPFKIEELFEVTESITSTPLDRELEKDGMNRRHTRRLFCHRDCYMISEGPASHRPVVARTQDISAEGLRVKYFGESLKPGERIKVRIGSTGNGASIRKEGQVVWARGLNHVVCAGVSFIEPIAKELLDSFEKDSRTAGN